MDDLLEGVSSIPYVNPFSRERVFLEKQVLGEAFVEYPEEGIAERHEYATNPNLLRIVEVAREQIEDIRDRLKTGRIKSRKVFQQYEDLVLLLMYYELAESMDKMIAARHAGSVTNPKFLVYEDFLSMSSFFFEELESRGFQRTHRDEHLFAIFFQIRRAYYHIFENFVGRSEVVRQLREDVWTSIFTHNIRRYARSFSGRLRDTVTLITGPSGTGKELVARAIGLSQYIPFDPSTLKFEEDFLEGYFPLNLAALSPTIVESELFGHKKGSFTGANEERKGFFESCALYGSVFLDEIGEVNESIQVKLLRLLQTRVFQRLGDTRDINFRGKLIAATNRDLEKAMNEGVFREDFYYRLCSDQIETPSFHEMVGGNQDELSYLYEKVAIKLAGEAEAESLKKDCLKWASKNLPDDYPWPGNFREFEQSVRNIMIRGSYSVRSSLGMRARAGIGVADIQSLVDLGLSGSELMDTYASAIYEKYSSIQVVSDVLKVDRRTARKHIKQLN